jgi:hypothetical protein
MAAYATSTLEFGGYQLGPYRSLVPTLSEVLDSPMTPATLANANRVPQVWTRTGPDNASRSFVH